jgi:dimethylhistidine N-methyltransferase
MPSSTPPQGQASFLSDVVAGLHAEQRYLPGKYLWDKTGSSIFDQICQSQDYYLTGREVDLLEQSAKSVAELVGPNAQIVEIGSGASKKVRILLDSLQLPKSYVAIDISDEFMRAAAARIEAAYPHIEVMQVCADFTLPLPELPITDVDSVLGFFPGASIANMEPDAAIGLMSRLRRALGKSWLLIGQDLNTEPKRLQKAYGSELMSSLHKNILYRLRDELGAELHPDQFRHEIKILDAPCRVEAHLVATEATEIAVSDHRFTFSPGESIRTDVSRKYTEAQFLDLLFQAGWHSVQRWTHKDHLFGLYLLRAQT